MSQKRLPILLAGLCCLGACSAPEEDRSPRMTAMLVVAYAQVGAAGPLFELLDPEDRKALEQEAARGSAGGMTVPPQDLLMIRVPPRDVAMAEPEVKTLEQTGDDLRLEVGFGDRSKYLMHLRRSQGRWRLRLPVSVKP